MGWAENGVLGLMLAIATVVYAVLLFLLPFFVLRIKKEVIAANQLLTRIAEGIELLSAGLKPPVKSDDSMRGISADDRGRLLRACAKCGAKNRLQDANCIKCGAGLVPVSNE